MYEADAERNVHRERSCTEARGSRGRQYLTAEALSAAGERVCAVLYRELGRWIGLDGCDAIVTRALDEVQGRWPCLAGVKTRPRSVPHLDGFAASVLGQDPADVIDALTAFLEVFIELLGAAIGRDLAQRLVWNAWRHEPPAPLEAVDQESKRHDW